MAITNLELVWNDGHAIEIELTDNPVSRYMLGCAKHLQHLDLEFNDRDNPLSTVDRARMEHRLVECGRLVGVQVMPDRLGQQQYLNELHDLYLQGYPITHDPNWLSFHDDLHSLEDHDNDDRVSVWVDYKHRAGPLIRPFDRRLLQHSVADVRAGDCCVTAHELGKTLWNYYRDRDLDTREHICQVVRPWQYLKPIMNIFYRPARVGDHRYRQDSAFRRWVDSVSPEWSQHWGITDWTPMELDAQLHIGRVMDLGGLVSRLERGHTPIRLRVRS